MTIEREEREQSKRWNTEQLERDEDKQSDKSGYKCLNTSKQKYKEKSKLLCYIIAVVAITATITTLAVRNKVNI